MNTISLIQGLRFIDNFFPSGGYAYSSGLEAAVQAGAVKDSVGLSRYVEDLLRSGMSQREALAAKIANEAGLAGHLEKALKVDLELESMKTGRETRLASRQMGRQVIKIAAEQAEGKAILKNYLAKVVAGQTPGHLAVSLGLTLGAAGWKSEETVAVFLYQTAVGFVSAAMRLLPIGQREGQRVLDGWLPLIGRISRQARTGAGLSSWSPVQDIYGMRHGQLEWRLFRS
jgi:urease accessory protein